MSEPNSGKRGRYARQIRFAPVGPEGQERLVAASVLVVGCGALGSVSAEQLVRAGVGRVLLVDRDLIEIHNLQRQPLFSEADIEEGLPKAIAAEQRLRAVNSEVLVEGRVLDFNFTNALAIARGMDLIVDGTDNFETRQLINDVSLELDVPWLYGGAVGGDGVVKAVLPGRTSCLRCLLDGVPMPGEVPTCETAGIIAPTAAMVASLQVSLALRMLTGAEVNGDLYLLDAWNPALRSVAVPRLADCPACGLGERPFLEGRLGGAAAELCGRDAVQVFPAETAELDLGTVAERLDGLGTVKNRKYYLEFSDGVLSLSIFPDGRLIVKGTDDPARARAAAAKYLGG